MKTPLILLFAILCAAPAVQASSTQEMQTKVSLEGLLESRLETILRKMLGTNEVFVIANADLVTDSERPDVEVLPGVVVKKTPSSPAPLELPSSLVRRVSLSIYVGRGLSDQDIETARKTAERMIAIKPERGDAVSVERLGASREPHEPASNRLDRLLEVRNLILIAWLLAAFAALALLSRKFFDPFIQVLRDGVTGLLAMKTIPSSEELSPRKKEDDAHPLEPLPAPVRLEAPAEQRKLPFSFITERDLPSLLMLIPEQADLAAAMVVQYLPPMLASRLLASMSPLKREKVLGYMSSAVLIDQGGVSELEENIRSRIDYIMGGEEKLVSLLDSSSVALQAEILATMELKDPELGRRLKRRVILLDDIALLDESGLGVLSRQVSVRSMAVVLKNAPHLQENVLPKLKGGLGEWLTQEVSLVADLPETVKEAELKRVLSTLVSLVREGRISLRKE